LQFNSCEAAGAVDHKGKRFSVADFRKQNLLIFFCDVNDTVSSLAIEEGRGKKEEQNKYIGNG
jgi:hypothetical protein